MIEAAVHWKDKAIPRLFTPPQYLDGIDIVYILGDSENPHIRVLFLRFDALPEMKCLRMTLKEYFEKLEQWRPKTESHVSDDAP